MHRACLSAIAKFLVKENRGFGFFVFYCNVWCHCHTGSLIFTPVVSAHRFSVHFVWAQIAGRGRVTRLCASTQPWLCGRPARMAVEWVSEWASLRYVHTLDLSVCRRRSTELFWITDWQLILGKLETRYNTLHYNANSVMTWLQSLFPIFLGPTYIQPQNEQQAAMHGDQRHGDL